MSLIAEEKTPQKPDRVTIPPEAVTRHVKIGTHLLSNKLISKLEDRRVVQRALLGWTTGRSELTTVLASVELMLDIIPPEMQDDFDKLVVSMLSLKE
jgi:hypothetical protein